MKKIILGLLLNFLCIFPVYANEVEIVTKDGVRHNFTSELAQTQEEQAKGLMFRRNLPAKTGMLFIFPFEQELVFWMKDTMIPLDLLFIKKDGTISAIHENAKPFDEAKIPSNGPALAVFEINGGEARQLGISAGDRLVKPILSTPQ